MKMNLKFALFAGWAVIAAIGIGGVIERFTHGHQAAAYGSYVVWGLWVSTYIYFIGLSAGSFLLSSLIYVFGMRQLERIGRLSLFVATITLLMALIAIWFDLGRMERAHRIMTNPNFGSMMAWMVWLYTIYTILMLFELWFAMREELARWKSVSGIRQWLWRCLSLKNDVLTVHEQQSAKHWLRMLALGGVPLAVAFHGGVGALFSTLSARSFWHTPLMPVLFLTGALVSGGALMAFTIAVFWPVRDEEHRKMVEYIGRVVMGLLIFDMVLEWAEFSVPMWYGIGREYHLLTRMIFGEFWWVFWIFHIGLGTVIPAFLLLTNGKRIWAVATAGFLIATTFMTVRLNIVIPGQIEPHIQGLQAAFVDHRLTFTYLPSFFEWQIVAFVVAFGIALFYLGYRFLPLVHREKF